MTSARRVWVYVLLAFFMQEMLSVTAVFNESGYPVIDAEQRLLHDLLSNYEKAVRPVENTSTPVNIAMRIIIQQIIKLDEHQEVLEMVIWDQKEWKDIRLRWNFKDYAGISLININPDKLWLPDIIPYNNVEASYKMFETMAVVQNTGHVLWIPPVRLKTRCNVDLTRFPFDEQTCTVKFGSWVFEGQKVNLTYYGAKASTALSIETNSDRDWRVVNFSAIINQVTYSCCAETFPDMTVSLTLSRNPTFYSHVLIAPGVIFGFLIPLQLLLPPDSKERLTLGSVLMVVVLVLNLTLLDVLPTAKSSIPFLQMYYLLTLIWNTITILISIVVLNAYFRRYSLTKVPEFIRYVFLDILKKLLFLGDQKMPKPQGFNNPAVSVNDLEGINQETENAAPASKVEKDIEQLQRYIHALTKISAAKESSETILEEWRQVASVLDRVLLIVVFLIFIISICILLM